MRSEFAIFDPPVVAEVGGARDPIHRNDLIADASTSNDAPQPVALLKVNDSTAGLDDEALLERLRNSEQDALAVLFRRYARAVRGIAFRILRSEPEADDLVQEVFLFLFQKAPAFNPSRGSARTWILFNAYNRALDRRKYLNSRHFYTSQEFEEELVRIPEERRERPSQGALLEEILGSDIAAKLNQQLSIDQLETIRLHFFEGHTLKEIAEIMGQSLVNVRNFYYRGLERIRKTILPAITRSK